MLGLLCGATALAGFLALSGCSSERSLQRLLQEATGIVRLPPGITEVRRELIVAGATDLEIVGSGDTVLKATADFQGRAVLVIERGSRIRLRNFTIDGNRTAVERPAEMPPSSSPFLQHFAGNGIALSGSSDVLLSGVRFREVAGLAILANKVKKIQIEKVTIEDSGSRNGKGRNNTSGGILFEEGTDDFAVRDSVFRRVLGNAVWTHSMFESPRNYRGLVANNQFEMIGRDAVQVGHANSVRVEGNTGRKIGYPPETVDIENGGIPVGIDTAGKVDESVYTKNRFEEINGKCIDLDGFHDGEVSDNVCINRGKAEDYPQGHFGLVMNNTNPQMQSQGITVRGNVFDGTKFGGIFVIGRNHRVINNKLRRINLAKCNESASTYGCAHFPNEPDLMQAGIYLGMRAERVSPAQDNLVEHNEVAGHRMRDRCVMSAPTVPANTNTVRNNICTDRE
jgi:hypothetical protein